MQGEILILFYIFQKEKVTLHLHHKYIDSLGRLLRLPVRVLVDCYKPVRMNNRISTTGMG